MSKPRVFIGSSKESIDYARAVQSELCSYSDAVLWQDANFTLGSSTLEALEKIINGYDFAVFIFSEDDQLNYRGQEYSSTRDNVIFEYGLFVGKLGRFRVFALTPISEKFHLLSDLQGINTGPFERPSCEPPLTKPSQDSVRSAVRSACVKIREQIEGGLLLKEQTLLEQISINVREIASATSTKYVGQFPHFFEEKILPCLAKSRKEIWIACDFPSYGLFSARKVHLDYMKLLRNKKADGVEIKSLFLNETRREEVTKRQMPTTASDWAKALTDATFAEQLNEFCANTQTPIDSWKALENALKLGHEYNWNEFKNKIAITCEPVDCPMPIYLWIADRERAIFSIPHFGVKPTEHGFETSNPDLVKSLERLWERYREKPDSEQECSTT